MMAFSIKEIEVLENKLATEMTQAIRESEFG